MPMTNRQETMKRVESLNVIDDALFQKMAEDVGFCEELLSTILGQKVTILELYKQDSIKNLQGRSVIIDARCLLEDGTISIVEVQNANDDEHVLRVRYETSCVTANITDPGTKFKNVPNVISIFISKFDIFKRGKTVYHIDRTIRETGDINNNGLQEIYVNAKVDDGTDIAKLMRIFKEHSTYDFSKFPKTSARKHQFLESEGGKEQMCEIVESYAQEVAREQAEKYARNLLLKGASFEMVKECIDSLSEEVLRKIYESVKGMA